jgi:DNA-binding response OmpR family regulator
MAKVLIAEDDKFLLKAYQVKLSKSGHDVKYARNGSEALSVLEEFSPDLVVLDLIMPGKDGFTVLEEMKKDEKLKHIPVLVTSNLGQKEDRDRAIALGAKDYIIKSDLSLNDLVGKINSIIAHH